MKLPEKRRDDVGILQIKVVTGTIKVSRHDRNKVCPVLPVIRLAHLYPGDLGNGIGLVRFLQIAGQEIFFLHRLGTVAGINAGTPQEQKFFNSGKVCTVDEVCLYHDIPIYELSRIGTICKYPADFCSGKKNIFGPLFLKKQLHFGLAGQIKFFACPEDNIFKPFSLQFSQNCGTDKPAMTGYVYL